MRKRKMNRALVVALSVAMASSNIAPTVTYAAEPSQILEASEQENPQEETSEQESKMKVESVSDDLQHAEQTVAEDKTITEETYLEYTPEEGNYTLSYQIRVNNGKKEAIIKGYGKNKTDRNITIPSEVSASSEYTNAADYQNIPVTAIDQGAFVMTGCPESVYIPASVESIGTNAFAGGEKQKVYTLKSVTIEEGSKLNWIGEAAFQSQAGLTSEIVIPDGVTKIGKQAFYNCEGLTKITFNGGGIIDAQAFSGCKNINMADGLVLPLKVTEIGDEAFLNYGASSTNAGKLELPNGLTSIGKKAFSGAKLKGNLVIPSSVESMGDSAFQSAYADTAESNMGTLSFENGSKLTSIPAYAFDKCLAFKGSIVIPDGVTSIGQYAFEKCSGMDGTLSLPSGLETIGNYAFSECSKLTGGITLPDTLTQLGTYAFNKCSNINGELVLSKNLKNIPQAAFSNCSSMIGSVDIPEGVQKINANAFQGCSSLNGTLTIPDTVDTIGAYAFDQCSSLNGSLIIPGKVTNVSNYAFAGCSGFDALKLSDSITTIGNYAFADCDGFKNEFVLPANLKTVGESSFSGCSGLVGNLAMPDTVTSVGKSAFAGMSGLNGYMYLSKKLTSFGELCFYGCTNLTNPKDEQGNAQIIEIAEGTTTLPQQMFGNCKMLTKIQVPKTVKTINTGVFIGTNSALDLYVYAGSDGAAWARNLSTEQKTFDVIYLDALASIKLSNNAYTMRVGSERDLSATIKYYKEENGVDVPYEVAEKDAPDKLTWTMNNKDTGTYASYADGKVSAIKQGTETIKATSPDGKTNDMCKVTVFNKYVTQMSSSDPATTKLNVSKDGEQTTITATIKLQGFKEALEYGEIKEEDVTLTCTPSVEGVVKIETGKIVFNEDYTQATVSTVITPVKSGNTVITFATSVPGETETKFTKTINVYMPLQSISIPETATVKVGGEKLKLTATLNPEGATTQKVTWKSSDTSVATINSTTGEITAKKAGTVTITCTPSNNSNYGDVAEAVTCTLTVLPKDGTTPTPTPDPTPNPNPNPEPTPTPTPTPTPDVEVPTMSVSYHTHVQTFGWEKTWKKDGVMSGTSGKAKRLEGIEIKVSGNDKVGIQYTTHCQSYGWLPWSSNGDMSGTEGEAKRLEAIKIQLTGADKDKYDIYYRVHAQSYGWLGWAKNGAPAGTAGYAKRLEGIQIVIVKKGEKIDENKNGIKSVNKSAYVALSGTSPVVNSKPTSSTNPTIEGNGTPNVTYRTHVQTYGWQGWKFNGGMSGTSGQAKRLEGIEIKLTNKPYSGGISYTTHVQSYGWQGNVNNPSTWKSNGVMSGTSGEAKRLEAICITLTGEMAEHYDIYYRVHAQTFGWLDWAKNGAPAGTAGYAKRLEGIEIKLVPKGGAAPGKTAKPYVSK